MSFFIAVTWLLIMEMSTVFGRAPSKYTDAFGRRLAWPLTTMSSTNETHCLDICFENYEFARHIVAHCDLRPGGPDTCAGSSFVVHDEEAIVLSFRGAKSEHQIIEGNATYGTDVPFPGGGQVQKYFYNAFMSVWKGGIKDDFLTFKHKYPNYEIWVVGHSLGGIMATIAATYISQLGYASPEQIKLIDFAGSRVGDLVFAKRIATLVPWSYRVVQHWDYGPHIPVDPKLQYMHGANEIWYNNLMGIDDGFIDCQAPESAYCSNSVPKKDLTWDEHIYYFEGGDFCKKWCKKSHTVVF